MTFVDCQFEIRPEVSLRSENVLVFVGITPDAPNPNTVTCPGHYLMTMSITPRVQGGRSRLWDGGELSANVMGDLMLIPPGYSLHSVFQDQAEERIEAEKELEEKEAGLRQHRQVPRWSRGLRRC